MYDVIVIGAGPAGSSLSIHLAGRGRSVLLLEKERMPRDKLCGEFLSREVAAMCARMGISREVHDAGALPITQLHCTSTSGRSVDLRLGGTALGLSRYVFDDLLFRRAAAAGATTRDGVAARRLQGCLRESFRVDTTVGAFHARVVVGAYGRQSVLDRRLGRPSADIRSTSVAFKAHFQGDFPDDLVELYAYPGGYCGLLREEGGRTNVCWIGRSQTLKAVGGSPQQMLEWISTSNHRFGGRVEGLVPEGGFLAAANMVFQPKELVASDVFMIGDAAGMIAPLCGDGIGMAIRSAELIAPMVDGFLTGSIDRRSLKRAYARSWKREFSRRMAVGRILQWGLSSSRATNVAAHVIGTLPGLARHMIDATRG